MSDDYTQYLKGLAKEVAEYILMTHGYDWQWDDMESCLMWGGDYDHMDIMQKEAIMAYAAEYARTALITVTLTEI